MNANNTIEYREFISRCLGSQRRLFEQGHIGNQFVLQPANKSECGDLLQTTHVTLTVRGVLLYRVYLS